MFGGVPRHNETERVSDRESCDRQLALLPRRLSAERRSSGAQSAPVFRSSQSDGADARIHGAGDGDGRDSRRDDIDVDIISRSAAFRTEESSKDARNHRRAVSRGERDGGAPSLLASSNGRRRGDGGGRSGGGTAERVSLVVPRKWRDDRDASGEAALHRAALADACGAIEALLEGGSDPGVRDREGRCAYALCKSQMARRRFMEYRARHPEQWELGAVGTQMELRGSRCAAAGDGGRGGVTAGKAAREAAGEEASSAGEEACGKGECEGEGEGSGGKAGRGAGGAAADEGGGEEDE